MRSLKRKEPEAKPETELAVPGRDLNDPGNLHVGFGKYRDLTLQQLVSRDKEYCRWVLSQSPSHFKIKRLQEYLKTINPEAKSKMPPEMQETVQAVGSVGPIPPWVQQLLNLSEGYERISGTLVETALTGLPVDALAKLHSYQKIGIAFGIQRAGRVLLADEMGLGKTVQALGIVAFYRREWPVLVVVPPALALVWKAEIFKWLNVQAVQVVRSGANQLYPGKDFYIISYDLLQRHPKFQECNGKKFEVVICDESHLLKNWHAQRTCQVVPVLEAARRAVLISGSPALNNAFELYPQLSALLPDFFTCPNAFGERYCCRDEWRGQVRFTGSVRPKELRQILSGICVRRSKGEVLSELPAKRWRTIPLALEVPSVLDSLQCSGLQEDDLEGQGYQSMYARVGLAKADLVADYIETLVDSSQDDKMLVFFHHEMVGNIIENKLKQLKVAHVRIDGKTPQTQRDSDVARFQDEPCVRIALLSITTCCLGLTLTAASTIVFAELYSVPKIMEQAEDRAHRIGQTKSVDVHYLVAHGTVDDRILASLAKKQVELRPLLDSNKAGNEVESAESAGALPAVRASARPLAQNAAMRGKTNAPRVRTVRSPALSGPPIAREEKQVSAACSKKQPIMLSDSEEEIHGQSSAIAPTMDDSDSDVEVSFDCGT